MTNGEAVQTFQKLGLSEYESRALATLFGRHDSTALDISKEAEIPYTKIYAVLTGLEKMGLIKCTLERPKKYRPLDPASVLSLVINGRESQLHDLKALAKEKQESLQEIFSRGEQYEGMEKVWYLPSKKATWGAVHWALSNAKESIHCISNKNIWEHTIGSKNIGDVCFEGVKKGAVFQNIIPASFAQDVKEGRVKMSVAQWEFFAHELSSVRVLPDELVKQNFIVKDKKEVGIPLLTPDNDEIHCGMVVNDRQLVDGILSYFNMLWEQALPVENEIRMAAKAALAAKGKRT